MGRADFWDDQEAAQKTVSRLKVAKGIVDPITGVMEQLEEAKVAYEMSRDAGDNDLLVEADETLYKIEQGLERIELLSLLSGKHDVRDCYFTISAGDGGTEANDWAEILMRMYTMFFDKHHPEWKVEEIALNHGVEVGIDDVTFLVKGPYAFGYLKCERGTHRLARVSPFNAQGKRQTSFATVDVTPVFEASNFEIPDKDLEFTFFARSSGPGGQNVNKVASACRVVHKPSGMMVVSSTHRDQLQNKRQALTILQAKLEEIEEAKREAEIKKAAGGDVSRGWGTQIRSYVFYDNRVKDTRTGHETGNVQGVLDGNLDPFIDAELKRRRKEQGAAERASG
ncbi:MAG: peptide chain release factor 2 [Phycisphaerales bacterium]